MSRIHPSLTVVMVVALLISTGANALPLSAASSWRGAHPERSAAESKDSDEAISLPGRQIASHPSTPQQEAAPLGTLATLAPTASGPSMYLNGSNYVNVPHASLPAIGSSDLTLEAWIYPTNVTGFHAVLAKQYNVGFWFGVYNGRLRLYRGSTSWVEGATVIPVNRWTHIAVYSYYDAFDNAYFAEFFINGDSDGFFLYNNAGAVGGTYDLHIGNDQNIEYFAGDIAEARLWLGIRGSESLRRDMHVAINEKRPGLVANWHLAGDFKDSINGIDGTPVGSPQFVGWPSPAQPLVTQTDRFFNTLPQNTYATAAAFVPRLNRAVVAGGIRAGAPSSVITTIDAGSGVSGNLGNLPAARSYATAAYATSNDTVYVFGGSDQLVTTNSFDTIYAINPETGAVRTVAATLPGGRNNATAVYLDHLNKIVVIGGWYYDPAEQYANSVYVFDVATESISTASFTLPQPGYGLAAAYSPLTQKVYYFGGSPDGGATYDDKGYAITLNADNSGSIETLTAKLPKADRGGGAVEDPISHLIYLINGETTARVIAFDPTSNELWQTPIELPRDDAGNLLIRPYSSVIYSPRQRHALVIGGGYYNTVGANNVWRIPLGDGPNVPIGHWGSINSFLGNIDYMSSVYWRVAMGRRSGAVTYFDSDYYVRYPGNLNATGLGGLTVDPTDGTTWFTTWNGNTVNLKRDNGSAIETRYTETRVLPVASHNSPDAVMPYNDTTPFFGNGYNLKWQNVNDYILHTWHDSFVAPGGPVNWEWTRIPAIAHRNFSEAWAIVEPWYTSLGRPESPDAPNAGPVATRPQLGRLTYEYYGTAFAQSLYGFPCGTSLWAKDLVFGPNGDWWIGGTGGVCRYSALYPPTSFLGNLFVPTIGSNVVKLSVDGDGRIWAALMPDASGSGGLSGYEVLGPANSLGTVRTQDWNWLTAPIGSRTPTASGWNSGIRALTANVERVWMALNTDPNSGPLVMYSPRWQQLTNANEGSLWGVRRVFLARGRAFIATNGDRLVTLQPDGITWDDRALAGVKAVLGDSRGRIWIGASDGVRRWTSTGWDMIDGALGAAPIGPINAIAEDARGRVWIGGENGLTLFDRERWVTTLQPPQGAISVTAVLVDRDDNVWAGTAQGLTRLNADQSWTTFTTADNLYTNHVFDLTQLGDGQIAVSTSGTGGGLSLFNGTTFVKQTYPPGKDQPLTADQTGRLWAGAIQREPTGYYGRFWTNSGLINSTVVDNAADGANLVWFTHPSGGVSIRSAFLPAFADVQPQINPANGVVPNRGSQGDTIVINGSGFGTDRAAVEVIIGGAPTDISTVSDNQITLRLRGDNLTGDVTVRRGKRSVTLAGATPPFCAVPSITKVTPTGGNVGVEVKITGSNFDVGATVKLGGGSVKTLGLKGAGTASAWIDYNDTNGNIVINNKCANTTATFNDFRKINVTLNRLMLNQGYVGMPFFSGNATLASAWLSVDQLPRATDVIQADHMRLEMGPVGSATRFPYARSITGTLPYTSAANVNAAFYADIDNALNLPNVIHYGSGPMEATLQVVKGGRTVASSSITVQYEAASSPRVLLIPIMPDGYSPQLLNDMKALVDANLADYRYRIYPGGLNPIWSDEVIPKSRVTGAVSITISNGGEQAEAGKEFERIRQRYNSTHGDQIGVSFGVVHTSVYTGAPGMAALGTLAQWQARQDCEDSFISDLTDFLGFGHDCGPEFPQFLGWAIGDNLASRYFAHELGHMMGMVQNSAANYGNYVGTSGGDNHSKYSELITPTAPSGTRIAACSEGGTFSANDSFYRQPGVSEPVVNPITGVQLDNQLADNNKDTKRAKSLLSYACAREGTNTYFDLADFNYLRANRYSSLRPIYQPGLLHPERSGAESKDARTVLMANSERLHVSGVITHDVGVETGAIKSVEVKDSAVKTSADYLTGYQLVQYGASNNELSRWGVLPLFDEVPNNHTPGEQSQLSAPQHPDHNDDHVGFFSANVPKANGVTRIDLVTGTLTLATFSAGSAAPVVSISSPAGGENYASGDVPIAWTATDANSDPLQVSLEFSRDNGATWTPIASANGSGTRNVPIEQLAGSTNARVRVWASDGFLSGTVTSNAFAIAAQPPRPYIITPLESAVYLEGQAVPLLGRADDPQDGVITSTLTWTSDRDGLLGTGEAQNILLSAGTHVITLQAVNSDALTASTTVIITVQPDYDADGLSDDREAALGLNALTERDAWGDTDGDGLTYIVELKRSTDPGNPDSDGDGRSDGDEVVDGSDPATIDPPRPNVLSVSPLSLTFEIDLSAPGQLPQAALSAFSNQPINATFSTSTPWIDLDSVGGRTPALTTVVINPIGLAEGPQYGSITVDSDLGSITVPITVTASNKADFCDANRDGATNQADITAVQSRVGSIIGDANYAVQYDVNRDGVIDAADVALISPCVITYGEVKVVYLPLVRK